MSRRALIDVALGHAPADMVVKGGKFVNVLTAEIYPADVAIKGDRIAYVGNVEHTVGPATEIIDAGGFFVTPGLIDTHQHSYETHLNMTEYARLLLMHGTTSITEAFYGVCNVSGIEAVRFCLDEIKRTPLHIVFLQPSLSYIQNTSLGLPSTPEALTQAQLWEILDWPECRGLEEPPFPVVVEKDAFWLDMFEATLARGKIIMGHGTSITERELAAYLAMGAHCDHSGADREDALMKIRMGCRLNAREGSAARNLKRVVKALAEYRLDSRGFSFCGDEVEFLRIVRDGHVDYDIRLAVGQGVNPITAVQMATLNAAEVLNADVDLGMISPGKIADIVLVPDL
ncbi:MAG: adenine deaminase, partial [Armatimonadetes bacterium]|nr:adenine deaminase [Armatimonadota bacterium]